MLPITERRQSKHKTVTYHHKNDTKWVPTVSVYLMLTNCLRLALCNFHLFPKLRKDFINNSDTDDAIKTKV